MFKVFPCGADKHPLINGWQQAATSDKAQLNKWYETFRDRLVYWGLPCGKANRVLVLDIDVKTHNGFESLKVHNLLCPTTMSQYTKTGGMHLLYQYPSDGNTYGNRVGVVDGVDIRGEGGYICVYDLKTKPIVQAPSWLLKEALKKEHTGEKAGASKGVAASTLDVALHNIRNACEGERNNTLNTEAFRVSQLVSAGALDRELAITLLEGAGREIGLSLDEVRRTIGSALKGAEVNPIVAPFGEPTATIDIPEPPVVERWTPTNFKFTDLTAVHFLRRPQLFKHWSTEDIHLTVADGGTGKTTLKLYESICLALGERFLGFENVQRGKTLYITGEDSREKIGAMLGKMMGEMGILDDTDKVNTVLNSVIVKKDNDLSLILKDRQNFLIPNETAYQQVLEAVKEIKPKMVVFDPIASFWGSEAALNDMAKAVSKFVSRLAHEGECCVEMINHMGKVSSSSKDMTQFAGRGGTGLPSHSRVTRVMREVGEEEYQELMGKMLGECERAIMVNVSKFTDGSPLYNKPFIVIRKGFLFRREDTPNKASREEDKKQNDASRVYEYIKDCSQNKMYPTKAQVVAHFASLVDKLSKQRVDNAINLITFEGYKGFIVKEQESPDLTVSAKVLVLDI